MHTVQWRDFRTFKYVQSGQGQRCSVSSPPQTLEVQGGSVIKTGYR